MNRREFIGGLGAFLASPDDIRSTFERAYRLFTYRKGQREGRAAWVKAGKPYEANCVGFSRTCADLLREKGYRPRLQSVRAFDGGLHMVCIVNGWVLDNKYPGLRTIRQAERGSRYEWI